MMRALSTALFFGIACALIAPAPASADASAVAPDYLADAPEIFITPDAGGWYALGEAAYGENAAFGGGLGYQWPNSWRADAMMLHGEQTRRDRLGDSVDLTVSKIFADVYWDADPLIGLTPYIGGGLGAAFMRTDAGAGAKRDSTLFAYALHGGIAFETKTGMKLDFGYTFINVPNGKKTFGLDENVRDHLFRIGARIPLDWGDSG